MAQLVWRKSTFSEPGSDTCVELALDPTGTVHLRESDAPGVVANAAPSAVAALLVGIKSGAVPRS
ncbi:DUF397 domain-containing protein [Streptomyces flaveus]|uniref:DUF397 domain-containing protein n=1 Tax=Streptomyces flaveus TaxID=66370 RepID=UPI003316DD3E